ncbi:reticulon-2b isoform X2 [Coregonus clupeaformis]|uniref:reticulon-2b isoform X2 n=1 Tax=Coregonus clupeaformis TaxID=59861 RepID=UPI001BE0F365|nr:reticulon-2b isoform X2 [Coregonus clupeaformis]
MAPKVMDLIYWRDVRKTGLVFTGLVIGLASLFQLSSVTMLSYLCMAIMCLTFPLRLYYKLLELIRKNPEGVHPFQSYIGDDSSLTDEETVLVVEKVVLMIAFAVTEIKRLLFIDSIMDSIKFVVLLYVLTYMGITTNGLTLVIVGEAASSCCSDSICCRDYYNVIHITAATKGLCLIYTCLDDRGE